MSSVEAKRRPSIDGALFAPHDSPDRSPDAARSTWLGRTPVALFAIAAGLFGLGNAWRAASSLWGMPVIVGESVMAMAILAWLAVSALYAAKWIWAREAARGEWNHPVQCCFVALSPLTTMLAALAVHRYAPDPARTLFWLGASAQISFMIYRVGTLWYGGRDPLSTTPVLYLPAVAGNFVVAIVASALGYGVLATLAFGGGLFSWLALESVVLHRLLVHEPIEKRLLPSLGIQLAPPAVGCVAYLGLYAGAADRFALMLLGYGLLQALVLLRLAPVFRTQPFAASYWAFSFGATALALAAIRLASRTPIDEDRAVLTSLAAALFVAANALVAVILVRTVILAARGKLIPLATVVTPDTGAVAP
ncbi:MAG: dicarboxylate transporter/tellurite-resistance protein TehA [Gemmatimonadaceae bacterium]|nr:dicarboxylate transporter/tellurite-resistance protein TehA [Gemmatimonadaceae bacterium]